MLSYSYGFTFLFIGALKIFLLGFFTVFFVNLLSYTYFNSIYYYFAILILLAIHVYHKCFTFELIRFYAKQTFFIKMTKNIKNFSLQIRDKAIRYKT